jgi:hypothetical protein
MALYRNDPWGGFRIDQAAATIASTLVNLKLDPKHERLNSRDFLAFPQSLAPKPDTTQQDVNSNLKLMFGARPS